MRRITFVTFVVALCGAGCALEDMEVHATDEAALVAAKGSASTLDIASWNIEWFGDTGNGPSNETLQLDNAWDVISGADMDIWGLAEIGDNDHFDNLVAQLSGYSGLLANDPSVIDGPAYYSGYNNTEQKVGIIYKSSLATVLGARIILTDKDYEFAGRPPLEVTLRVTLNGTTEDIVVIVLHAKCCTDSTSWTRRSNGSIALKSYLDANHPTTKVWVIGDYNDDVDTSISSGRSSPYENFVNDPADYVFPTKALSDAGISSTVSYSDMIDHHLATNEGIADYIAGSAEVYRVDQYITNYANTTSDHYPVLSRYTWSGSGGGGGGGDGGGTPAEIVVNEICANEPGSNTVGEFIEIVNIGGTSADISGWTLSDASATRHTFASGTTLAAGKAIVVFGGSSGIPSGLTNAVAASTGGLSLANGGDTVKLKNASGVIQFSYTYPSSLANSDGVSMNRNPDGDAAGSFVKHNTLSSLSRSAGTRASGASW